MLMFDLTIPGRTSVLVGHIPGIGITSYNYGYRSPYLIYYHGVSLVEYDNNADSNGNTD